jgi:hypothetical protein
VVVTLIINKSQREDLIFLKLYLVYCWLPNRANLILYDSLFGTVYFANYVVDAFRDYFEVVAVRWRLCLRSGAAKPSRQVLAFKLEKFYLDYPLLMCQTS